MGDLGQISWTTAFLGLTWWEPQVDGLLQKRVLFLPVSQVSSLRSAKKKQIPGAELFLEAQQKLLRQYHNR